ncbi:MULTISPECIES: lycopene cyclase family protein [unclassified Flavobacterium]|uniref:lycopene cyclase family protein n=1 Tax=unclassified Flavobacterium TaxID=196869 RepID=UPI001F1413C0|nr:MULTISPECIES: lycopene cyclase family protein [unclassified Flavobacterium]UMY66539.1 lycopene cyclase family protein [Flavobacterium sp. HJ-32-4]
MERYDYIFAGSGLAALMTAYKMLRSGRFGGDRILMIDPDRKSANDRTWCFWDKRVNVWDDVVGHEWEQAFFADDKAGRTFALHPYRYRLIRSGRFYEKIKEEIRRHPNVYWLQEEVVSFADEGNNVRVMTRSREVVGHRLFNSLYSAPDDPRYPMLQQHFVGWFVKTPAAAFDPSTAGLMDFSVPQKGNTRFMYVLPFSPHEALVEYTLFSKDLLPKTEYEDAIRDYLSQKGITTYDIQEEEQGSIPMTTFPFWKRNTQNILHIGTAGGWTKASTGYTFRNTDKLSDRLVAFLSDDADFRRFHKAGRFLFYDALLLDVLWRSNEKGRSVFSALFRKGDPSLVFRFLDEETTLAQDLAIIWRCPKVPFLKALWHWMARRRYPV